jgi:hypothetical protein
MELDLDLPLALRKITEDVDVADALAGNRLLCFMFPRRAIRNVVGVASRFYDLAMSSDAPRTHDIMFTAHVMRVLATPGLVTRTVERAFVDDGDAHVIAFYILLCSGEVAGQPAYNSANFALDSAAVLSANSVALGRAQAPQPAAAGGEQHQRPVKKMRGPKPANNDGLVKAYELVHRPTIPVDHIRLWEPFNTRVTAWGELLVDEDDLRRAMKHSFACRLAELGRPVVGDGALGRAAGDVVHQGAAAAAEADSSTDEADSPPVPPAANADTNYTVTFTLETGAPISMSVVLSEYLQVTHPLTECFVRPSLRTDQKLFANEPNLWELASPRVDLPCLSSRYLAHTIMYDSFALYAASVRARRDFLEANSKGDLSMLSSFFADRAAERDADPAAAARLTFDILTRPDGRLPKATAETMAQFVDMLNRNDRRLPPGSDVPVVKYKNLSYSGNYAVHLLEQFELSGTFHFHVEQFITMLVLDGVLYRPAHEDDEDDQSNVGMCANLLNYGPPGVGKSNASLFFLNVYKFSYVTNTYSSLRSIYSNLPCSDFLNCKASYNDEAPAWIPESGGKRAPQVREGVTQPALPDARVRAGAGHDCTFKGAPVQRQNGGRAPGARRLQGRPPHCHVQRRRAARPHGTSAAFL